MNETNEKKIYNRLASVGIAGNVLLSAFKFYAGLIGNSGAMISDAVHSLSDVIATIIAYAGVRISKRDADDSHPYGHERFESLATVALSIILIFVGIGIGATGFDNALKIIDGQYVGSGPEVIALAAAIVSILVKEAMFWYTIHYARILHSPAFRADAWHHRSDAISSVAALVGIGGAILGVAVLEPIASVAICALIVGLGASMFRSSINQMLDSSVGCQFEDDVRSFLQNIDGVKGVDSVMSRQFGIKVCVDIEISVDGKISLNEAHDIAHHASDALESNFPNIKHTTVHVNPFASKK